MKENNVLKFIKKNQTSETPLSHPSLSLYLGVALSINLAVLFVGIYKARGLGTILGFSGRMLLALWPFLLISIVLTVALMALRTRWADVVVGPARFILKIFSYLRNFNFVLFIIPILLVSYYFLAGITLPILTKAPYFWTFGNLVILGAVFLSSTRKIQPSYALLASFSIYSLIIGVVYYIPEISSYSLSLGWSETSRYYDASLFFSRWVYGARAPLPSLDPTRAFLQSLPFLIPSVPIWVHRIWKVLLCLGITFTASMALANRIQLKNRWVNLALVAWFFVYSLQGPVYYHLMVVVIIVLLGFDKDQLRRTLVFVGLASLWAGVSRVNWFPVAGVLAVILYVLEVPQEGKSFWQYWRWPVGAVVLGLALAFGSQAVYAAISGNSPEAYVTSFNSPLYWYRLFPNEAYGPGVIHLAITASFPLWLGIVWRLLPNLKAWRWSRVLVLLSVMIVFLVAGLIVSAKIGGGNNLHNLDSYLIILAVIATYLCFNRFKPDDSTRAPQSPLPILLIVLAFLVPMESTLTDLEPYLVRDESAAQKDIQLLQIVIDALVHENGEVLFIQHRHLLTFGLIEGVDLVPEYEKVALMEMAMSNNETYLEQFWQDLEDHRFAVIVTEPLAMFEKSSSDTFGEENNIWRMRVEDPLTASYHTLFELSESGMSIMIPNSD